MTRPESVRYGMRTVRCDSFVVVCGLWLALGACGDDDGGPRDAGADSSAGAGGIGGASGAPAGGTGSTGPVPITPLADDTAGNPCTSNAECDRGMCATQITGAAVLPAPAP